MISLIFYISLKVLIGSISRSINNDAANENVAL